LAASHQTFRYVIKTLSMTSLSEWSARRKSLYTGQHNTEWRGQTCLKQYSSPRSQCPIDLGLRLRLCGHWVRNFFVPKSLKWEEWKKEQTRE
jgi:hypothetical protein